MFKLAVLFAVAAVAVASPGALLPVHTAVLPAVSTVSRYDTSIVDPGYTYVAPSWHGANWYNVPTYHHLRKRSLAVAPVAYSTVVAPAWGSWGNPWGYGYGARYAAPWGSLGYGYGYPRALAVHPY